MDEVFYMFLSEGYVFSAHTRSDRDVSLRKDMLIPFDVTPIDTGGVFDTSQAIFVCPLDGTRCLSKFLELVTNNRK